MVDPTTNESYENILNLIALGLGVTLGSTIHNNNINYYIISASSNKSRLLIVDYFKNYPLFSSKYLNYLDWFSCHNLIISGNHLSQEGFTQALILKQGMNNKRTYYNWDHLHILKSY